MVDPGGLYHRSALLGFPDPGSRRIYALCGAQSTANAAAALSIDARVDGASPGMIWSPHRDGDRGREDIVKLVTFQIAGKPDLLPGLFTDRGVVSLADAVPAGAFPDATMTGIIDNFDRLRPALERLAR